MTNIYIPGKLFVNNYGGGKVDVCPITYGCNTALPVANNNLAVAAVTGKRILVIGGSVYSNGAFTQLTFRSESGGSALKSYAIPANTVATPNVNLCPNGLFDGFETATGIGLYVDNSAVIAIMSLSFITYTP